MAANPINVVTTLLAVQYTGDNSDDIIALDAFDFNNSTESNGVWSFTSPPDSTSFTFQAGEWLLFAQNMVMGKASDAELQRTYSCNALCEDVGSAVAVRALGVGTVPELAPSATATVTVSLGPVMADAGYTAYASTLSASDNLGITSVTVVDEATVDVGVQNFGPVTLDGSTLLVHAVA